MSRRAEARRREIASSRSNRDVMVSNDLNAERRAHDELHPD
jgi:hypothetical protein